MEGFKVQRLIYITFNQIMVFFMGYFTFMYSSYEVRSSHGDEDLYCDLLDHDTNVVLRVGTNHLMQTRTCKSISNLTGRYGAKG
jgi:hypothetical protein